MSGTDRSERASARPVLDLLAGIKSGAIAARSLSVDARRRCVECLMSEGMTTAEIAKLLERDDRTIRRDMEKIRRENAIACDGSLGPVLGGEMLREMRQSVGRLRRLGREKDVSVSDRIESERACVQLLDITLARLQKLGAIGTATGDDRAGADNRPLGSSVDAAELDRLLGIAEDDPAARLRALKQSTTQASAGGTEP